MILSFFSIELHDFVLSEFDRFQTGKFNKLKYQLEEVDLTDGRNLIKIRYSTLGTKYSLKIVSQLHSLILFPARYILGNNGKSVSNVPPDGADKAGINFPPRFQEVFARVSPHRTACRYLLICFHLSLCTRDMRHLFL